MHMRAYSARDHDVASAESLQHERMAAAMIGTLRKRIATCDWRVSGRSDHSLSNLVVEEATRAAEVERDSEAIIRGDCDFHQSLRAPVSIRSRALLRNPETLW